jgi:putative CocE/NonD family hydrolase
MNGQCRLPARLRHPVFVRSYVMPLRLLLAALFGISIPAHARADIPKNPADYVRTHYIKQTHQIPMRDGVRLYTVVYTPKDTTNPHPMLMTRTPYGVAPYGASEFRSSLGPSGHFLPEKFIFVYQDVRGCYMSEGAFENMRPQRTRYAGPSDVDESTDTYDTIEYLVRHVPNHNGKVGLWGVSYPGFYSSAGMINAHPALQAVSPQAPIADWFFDDFFHHGAFFLPHAFNFFSRFGHARPEPTTSRPARIDFPTRDGYQFFLDAGSLKNIDPRYFKGRIHFWNTMAEHPNYDAFWQARNILPHLKKVAPAVMTVGGWFDAEDLYGPLKTYRAVEKQNPGVFNVLVMGPWAHGGWTGGQKRLGHIDFGQSPGIYHEQIELKFFNHFLRGKGEHDLPEAYLFDTGAKRWHKFDHWPPRDMQTRNLFLGQRRSLAWQPPEDERGRDTFVSDPRTPVPHTETITTQMTYEYMTDDQRYASRRPDVLTYRSEVLDQDVTLAGPVHASLHVATTGTDADWIVKLIDVFPDNVTENSPLGRPLAGYQLPVRSEIIRGRFRNSYERPEPFVPNQPALVRLELLDVLHTFKKGHRIMVQVHSTWFPLADRNPQKYVPNIFQADDDDFQRATHTVYRSRELASHLRVGVLP